MSDLSGHGDGNGSDDVKVENPVAIAFSELVGKYGQNAGALAKLVYSLEILSGLVTVGRSQVDSLILYSRYSQIANNILLDMEQVLGANQEVAQEVMKWVSMALAEFSSTMKEANDSAEQVEQKDPVEDNPLNVVQYSTVENFQSTLKEAANEGRVTVDSLESRTVH